MSDFKFDPSKQYIAVDLDRTLAHHTSDNGITTIGNPVEKMLFRVKKWINEGKKVKILTARAAPHVGDSPSVRKNQIAMIHDWLVENGLPRLEVTCIKDKYMKELWDDRAISVAPNTGKQIGGRLSGFSDSDLKDLSLQLINEIKRRKK